MTNKKKTKETKKKTKVINPNDTPKGDDAKEDLKKRIDFANLEIQRTLERYELALLPFFHQQLVGGLTTSLESKVTLVDVKKKKDEKKTN